jgi:hypothetical protein
MDEALDALQQDLAQPEGSEERTLAKKAVALEHFKQAVRNALDHGFGYQDLREVLMVEEHR